MRSHSWPVLIAKLVEVKQLVEETNPGFWPHHYPEVGASPEVIDHIESVLERKLPWSYRQFLLHANGWKGFFQTVDLLSCEQLVGSSHREYFDNEYGGLCADDWARLALRPEDLVVIGVTLEDRDAFVLNYASDQQGEREVVWLAGDVVDRWVSFYDFFLSMIEYNKREASPIT